MYVVSDKTYMSAIKRRQDVLKTVENIFPLVLALHKSPKEMIIARKPYSTGLSEQQSKHRRTSSKYPSCATVELSAKRLPVMTHIFAK